MAARTLNHSAAVVAIQKLNHTHGGARSLEFYREVGKVVRRLKTGYGTQNINKLAESLGKAGIDGMKASTLRKAGKMVEVLTAAQTRALCKKGVSWRAAGMLATNNLSDSERKALIRRIANGRLKPQMLGAEIKKCHTPAKTRIQSVAADLANAIEKISRLKKVAGSKGVSDDVRSQAADALKDISAESGKPKA